MVVDGSNQSRLELCRQKRPFPVGAGPIIVPVVRRPGDVRNTPLPEPLGNGTKAKFTVGYYPSAVIIRRGRQLRVRVLPIRSDRLFQTDLTILPAFYTHAPSYFENSVPSAALIKRRQSRARFRILVRNIYI